MARRTYFRKIVEPWRQQLECRVELTDSNMDQMFLRYGDTSFTEVEVCFPDGYSFLYQAVLDSSLAAARRRFASVPAEYAGLRAKDFDLTIYGQDTKEIKALINRFLQKYPKFECEGIGLYIFSSTKGSGKTMLSCILLNELVERYAAIVCFSTVYDLVDTASDFSPEGKERFARIRNAKLLVVDDFGANVKSEWIDAVFFKLIDYRYANRLVTIFTSNVPLSRLKVDERVTSRIHDRCLPLHLPEVSVRDQRAEQRHKEFLKSL